MGLEEAVGSFLSSSNASTSNNEPPSQHLPPPVAIMDSTMKILLAFLVLSILVVLVPGAHPRGKNQETKPYPWVYTKNVCQNKTGSIYDRCYTEDKNPCNSTVCCLGYTPENEDYHKCINDKNCTYFIHYEYEGPLNVTLPNDTWILTQEDVPMSIKFNMVSRMTSPHYFAFALSSNDRMGNDLVFVCELKKNLEVELYLRWNHQKGNLRTNRFATEMGIIENVWYDKEAKQTHCNFTLFPNLHYYHKQPAWNFSLHKDNHLHDKYYNLIAVGKVGRKGQLQYHQHAYITGHINNRWAYTNQCIVTAGLPSYFGEKLHAGYMVSIWIILIPINTFIARYFKGTWNHKFFDFGPLWLVVHKVLSLATFLMLMVGYTFASAERNYEVASYYPAFVHSIFGFITLIFLLLEFALGGFRVRFYSEKTERRMQVIHSFLHFWVLFLGYITIIAAPYFTYNVMPCGIYHSIYPFILVQVAFHALMVKHHKKVDENMGFDVDRSLKEYPLTVSFPETQYRWRLTMHMVILGCYLASSIGFASLIIFHMVFDQAFGPPCLPYYNHIPLKDRKFL